MLLAQQELNEIAELFGKEKEETQNNLLFANERITILEQSNEQKVKEVWEWQ